MRSKEVAQLDPYGKTHAEQSARDLIVETDFSPDNLVFSSEARRFLENVGFEIFKLEGNTLGTFDFAHFDTELEGSRYDDFFDDWQELTSSKTEVAFFPDSSAFVNRVMMSFEEHMNVIWRNDKFVPLPNDTEVVLGSVVDYLELDEKYYKANKKHIFGDKSIRTSTSIGEDSHFMITSGITESAARLFRAGDLYRGKDLSVIPLVIPNKNLLLFN